MRPNIVLIMTDQQRWDTLGAAGYPYMITPHLDTLCRGGVTFTSAFAPAATCIASRAALFTGMYPHNTGVYSFNPWAHHDTWIHDLAEQGYYCANIGKMHTSPIFDPNGFHERQIVENKCEDFHKMGMEEDEWGRFLLSHGLKRPLNRAEMYDDWKNRLNATAWEYEDAFHSDWFTGDLAVSWIQKWDRRQPLFLQIGFPGPHEPYDPPQRFLDLYRDVDVPGPIYTDSELAYQPPQHMAHKESFQTTTQSSVINFEGASDEQIKDMRKHYYANITLIDQKIGEILTALDQQGVLDNTVLIFTSDHGDCLGDHRLPYKWLMYDPMVHVPLIIRDFRTSTPSTATFCDDLVSLIDIGPTILRYAGLAIPTCLEGNPLNEAQPSGDPASGRNYVFCEDNYLVMIRSKAYKMVYYIAQEYGELYDLTQDPHELRNMWNNPEFQAVKCHLKNDLLDWLAKSNYFNAGYKHSRARHYRIRWPNRDGYGVRLHGQPFEQGGNEPDDDIKTC